LVPNARPSADAGAAPISGARDVCTAGTDCVVVMVDGGVGMVGVAVVRAVAVVLVGAVHPNTIDLAR